MPGVTIRLRPNGPLVVEGEVTILDEQGNVLPINTTKPNVALCRCGQSKNKPFCDGTHRDCGFVGGDIKPPALT